MFKRDQGATKFMYLPVSPNVPIAIGSLVGLFQGTLIPAFAAMNTFDIVGVIRHAIVSTDKNFTSSRLIEVDVPTQLENTWLIDVIDGTIDSTSIGKYFDLTQNDDGSGIDANSSIVGVARCVKVISSTQGLFTLNIGTSSNQKINI